MYRKAQRAARGELAEPSVVQTAAARAIGGVPNALWGIAYYLAVAAGTPFLGVRTVTATLAGVAGCAALFSLYLGYSLLFRTRQACAYCWSAHAVNWILFALLLRALLA